VVTKYSAKNPSSIAFVCLDILKNVSDTFTTELVKNLADYTIQNLVDHGYDVYITKRYSDGSRLFLDVVLREIKDKYDYVVVYTNDTEFEGSGFFTALNDLVKEDFFVAGHILDRVEFGAYYEIHDQCFVVNLEQYKKLGCLDIGEARYEGNKKLRKVIPSKEHYHDYYTPKSVIVGNTTEVYKNLPFGWNWINTGATLKVFDESIRNTKRNYYSKYPSEFHKNIAYNFMKHQYASAELFYPANTETPVDIDINNIEQIVVPASGFNFLYYLDKHGYNENTEVVFYDNNPHSLKMMKFIIENFDGTDYVKFVRTHCSGIFASDSSIHEHWNTFKSLWHIVGKVKFSYEKIDAMYQIPNKLKRSSNAVYNLTNVFSYEPNIAFRSLSHRIESQNSLFDRLRVDYKDVNIIISAYADQGFGKEKQHSLKASDLAFTRFSGLNLPSWHNE
jgi:hypothetical protein